VGDYFDVKFSGLMGAEVTLSIKKIDQIRSRVWSQHFRAKPVENFCSGGGTWKFILLL